jgi:hypothetical protein
MKTALILTAALSAAPPAQQPPIQMYGIQPGARMEYADPGGCVAMTTGDMKRLLDKLNETCPAKKGASI